jgi:hypothetical protein
MRTLLFAMGLLVASGIGARAETTNYPWCSKLYGTNCGFSTLAQCQASAQGADQCVRNPDYVPPGSAAGSPNNKRKHQ